MCVECKDHGMQGGTVISPDLSPPLQAHMRQKRQDIEIVSLIYFIDDNKVIAAFYVSRAFADKYGLEACVRDVSNDDDDDVCEWHSKLTLTCVKCFKETYRGYFDGMYRWHPGEKPPHVTEPEGG